MVVGRAWSADVPVVSHRQVLRQEAVNEALAATQLFRNQQVVQLVPALREVDLPSGASGDSAEQPRPPLLPSTCLQIVAALPPP